MSKKEIFFIKIFIAIIILGFFWFVLPKKNFHFEGYNFSSYNQSYSHASKVNTSKKDQNKETSIFETSRNILVSVNINGFNPSKINVYSDEKIDLVLNSLDQGTYTLTFEDSALEDVVLAVGAYGKDQFVVKDLEPGVYSFYSKVYSQKLIEGQLVVEKRDLE
jgi:hypothetical protein